MPPCNLGITCHIINLLLVVLTHPLRMEAPRWKECPATDGSPAPGTVPRKGFCPGSSAIWSIPPTPIPLGPPARLLPVCMKAPVWKAPALQCSARGTPLAPHHFPEENKSPQKPDPPAPSPAPLTTSTPALRPYEGLWDFFPQSLTKLDSGGVV